MSREKWIEYLLQVQVNWLTCIPHACSLWQLQTARLDSQSWVFLSAEIASFVRHSRLWEFDFQESKRKSWRWFNLTQSHNHYFLFHLIIYYLYSWRILNIKIWHVLLEVSMGPLSFLFDRMLTPKRSSFDMFQIISNEISFKSNKTFGVNSCKVSQTEQNKRFWLISLAKMKSST